MGGETVKEASTLAARPVEASSIVWTPTLWRLLTSAPMTEVFPVPAYPLRMNTESLGVSAEQKRASAAVS